MIYKTSILALSMFFMLGATPTKKKEVIRFIMPSYKANCFTPLPCVAYAIGWNTMGTGINFSDTITIKVDKECIEKEILPLLKKDDNGKERQIRFRFR
mgnify:CR=1 FL=1